MKTKIGFLLFGCLWFLLGGLSTLQYTSHGYITLKGGTVISGTQAIVISLSIFAFGIIFVLVTLRGFRGRS